MTHASLLDDLGNLDEKLLILLGIFTTDKDLNWEPIRLDLVEVFCWQQCQSDSTGRTVVVVVSEQRRTFLGSCENVEGLGGEEH